MRYMSSRFLPLCALGLLLSSACATATTSTRHFDPRSFPKNVATCKAINRKQDELRDINISYVEVNPLASQTIIMVHGWPGLWSNWAHQILEFQDDYHIIAIDHRGFGLSTHPDDVESSGTVGDLVGDLSCVLEDAGVDSAICLGHDWGAQVCWEAARMRPDLFEAVAAAVVPYMPSSSPFTPISTLVHIIPRLAYILYFQEKTTEAIAELDRDIRKTLRSVYRSIESAPPDAFLTSKDAFLEAYEDEIAPIPFLTEEEEDYLVEQFSIQGFKNTLQFYTHGNRYAAWELANSQGNHTISQPALVVFPTDDPVADWAAAMKLLGSEEFVPNLTVENIRAAHWIQLENPAEFNAVLRRWLDALPGSHEGYLDEEGMEDIEITETTQKHFVDEL
ncbi:hypothetical protein M0805_006429 [Coniferiporia weirii]|nr:hypothetical protein M0805_006429 [Coniferiporia weirii]